MAITTIYKPDNLFLLLLEGKTTGQRCPSLGRKKGNTEEIAVQVKEIEK